MGDSTDVAGLGRRTARPVARLARAALGLGGLTDRLTRHEAQLGRIEARLADDAGQAAERLSRIEARLSDDRAQVAERLSRIEAGLEVLAARLPTPRGDGFVEFSLPDGSRYTLSTAANGDDSYRSAVAQNGGQAADWRLCMAWLRPGEVFFDVGANIGIFGIPAAVLGAEVHAFELLADNARRMVEAMERNRLDNAHLTLGAVWDRTGGVGFAGFSAWGVVQPQTRTSVASIKLDDYVEQHGIGRVHVMKLDVEGSEKRALAGAEALIARDHPDILIESNSLTCGGFGYSYRDLLHHLAGRGYAIYRVGEDALHPWPAEAVQEVVQTDYLATVKPAEDVAQRSRWPVRALSTEEQIQNVLGEDRFSDYHRMHLLAVHDQLPEKVRSDGRVAALLDGWQRLAQAPEMATLRVGASRSG